MIRKIVLAAMFLVCGAWLHHQANAPCIVYTKAVAPGLVETVTITPTPVPAGTASAATQQPTPTITNETMPLCEEEREMLARIAMAEAEGEGLEGKALVVCVVLNRVRAAEWPDTVTGVLWQDKQFAPMCDGRWERTVADAESYAAVDMVLAGWDKSQGAMYFESVQGECWHSRNLEYLFTYGGHDFYK